MFCGLCVFCRDAVRAQISPQNTPPAGTGIIRGRVLRSDGRALARVQIRLAGLGGRQRFATTDADGRYEVKELPGGSYTLAASREGFITLEFGQQRPFERGRPIALADGETLDRVDLILPSTRAIVGRVVDDNGGPVEGASVQVMQLRFATGRRRLVRANASGGQTNDLGRYRAYGLEPGEYVIGAAVGGNQPGRSGGMPGYAPTYFPGTANVSDAQFVTLGLFQDLVGVDIPLVRARTARVSGLVYDASGSPLRIGVLLSQSERSGGLVEMPMTGLARADGGFDIANVPPGEYVLQAIKPLLASPRTSEAEFASQFVTVNGRDVAGLVVRTSIGSTVSGRITLEGDATTVTPRDFALSPVPVDFDRAPLFGSGYRALVHDDWTFEMGGLSGPRVFRLTGAPPGWSIKAVRVHGIDVTDIPQPLGTRDQSLTDVEVVVTSRAAAISGTVADSRGQAAFDYTALVFATDRQRWTERSRFLAFARPGQDGGFVVRGLPPGEYFVAAVDRMEGTEGSGEWQDPMVLEQIAPRAMRVTLTESQKLATSLKLIAR